MSRKNKVKNENERKDYNNFIIKSNYSPETTIPTYSETLHGSNEGYDSNRTSYDNNKAPVKTPFKIKIMDFIKEHLAEIIVTVILIPLLIGLVKSSISSALDIREIETRIEYIEKEIAVIQDDLVSKDTLESELKLIQKDIESQSLLNIEDIKRKIEHIEKELYNN